MRWKIVSWQAGLNMEAGAVAELRDTLDEMFGARSGHFVFESGHHGDLWLELETLCARPGVVRPLAVELGRWAKEQRAEMVCGPLVEGAFVALMAAEEIGAEFVYAERIEKKLNDGERGGLFPVEYRLPEALRGKVRGRRVAIVNDVINAGSAVRGTAADLVACGAELVGLVCLLTLGEGAASIAKQYGMPLFRLASRDANLWTPEDCPICREGVALTE